MSEDEVKEKIKEYVYNLNQPYRAPMPFWDLPIMESMACGTPVIITDYNKPELIESSDNNDKR